MEKLDIALLFNEEMPIHIETKNTSHGNEDFRETLFVEYEKNKLVIKLSDNGFTDEEHLMMWESVAEKYIELGYYCPRFIRALDNTFPKVLYHGHQCIAWGEEYSLYRSASELIEEKFADGKLMKDGYYTFFRDALLMNAKVASMHYNFTKLPSAYCMFEVFDPNDQTDETTEDAFKWKKEADKLPEKYQPQVHRIWNHWLTARRELEQIYFQLPTSVFQADLNDTNVLLDEEGKFKGVYDFNIAGKEVFVNLLVREAPYISTFEDKFEEKDYFLNCIGNAIQISSEVYEFNELEKKALPLLYRCIKPLYWYSTDLLVEAFNDDQKIQECLDFIEYEQTRTIDFFDELFYVK